MPKDAINLREFLRKYKEKDESREFDIGTSKKQAEVKLEWAHNFLRGPNNSEQVEISPWMLADTEVYNAYLAKKQNLIA